MKRTLYIICIVSILLSLSSCLENKKSYEGAEQVIKVEELNITLTDEFFDNSDLAEDFLACYGAADTTVFFTKETFEEIGADKRVTVGQYINYVRDNFEADEMTSAINEGGVVYFTYVGKGEVNYKYFVAAFKSEDAFWTIQFACEESVYDEYKPYFLKWSRTVTFNYDI
jgi:hypothetical protein